MWLRRYSNQTRKGKHGKVIASKEGIHASHPKYTDFIRNELKLLEELDRTVSLTPAEMAKELEKLTEKAKKKISMLLKDKQLSNDLRLNNFDFTNY